MGKNISQELQEEIVQNYVTGTAKDSKDLQKILAKMGYDVHTRNIERWKCFELAREDKRARELEESRDKLSNSLVNQVEELTKSMEFYNKQSNKIRNKIMEDENMNIGDYTKYTAVLEKIEKAGATLYDKYLAIVKLVQLNSPVIKTDDDQLDAYDKIMSELGTFKSSGSDSLDKLIEKTLNGNKNG